VEPASSRERGARVLAGLGRLSPGRAGRRLIALARAVLALLTSFFIRGLAKGIWRFVRSRRWLLGSLVVTCLLLVLVLRERPPASIAVFLPAEPETVFDEVHVLSPDDFGAPARFRPPLGASGVNSTAASPPASAPGQTTEADRRSDLRVSRRLDAVRARQARGAWLTGTIESLTGAPESETVAAASTERRNVKQAVAPAGRADVEQAAGSGAADGRLPAP
jgi:hypothetical protein